MSVVPRARQGFVPRFPAKIGGRGGMLGGPVQVITDDMLRLLRDIQLFPYSIAQAAQSQFRLAAFAMITDIRLQMPVDTGAATRSWANPNAPQFHPDVPMQGVFSYEEGLDEVFDLLMGGNWYIRELEQGRTHFLEGTYGQPERFGTSRQAPPGFIRSIIDRRMREFMRSFKTRAAWGRV